ncbi:MAG: hypothetical protein RBU37_28115 [Myxococcota bacterium]|nr:hypothetical protein [Myxococcota bacterium]
MHRRSFLRLASGALLALACDTDENRPAAAVPKVQRLRALQSLRSLNAYRPRTRAFELSELRHEHPWAG